MRKGRAGNARFLGIALPFAAPAKAVWKVPALWKIAPPPAKHLQRLSLSRFGAGHQLHKRCAVAGMELPAPRSVIKFRTTVRRMGAKMIAWATGFLSIAGFDRVAG
jgi:hypothetical protein